MPEMGVYTYRWIRHRFHSYAHYVFSDQFPIGDLVHIVPTRGAPVVFTASQAWPTPPPPLALDAHPTI